MLKRIRAAMGQRDKKHQLSGIIEVDCKRRKIPCKNMLSLKVKELPQKVSFRNLSVGFL